MKDSSGMDGCGSGGSCSSWRSCRPRLHLLAKDEAKQSSEVLDGEMWSCCFSRVFSFADAQSVGGGICTPGLERRQSGAHS